MGDRINFFIYLRKALEPGSDVIGPTRNDASGVYVSVWKQEYHVRDLYLWRSALEK